MGPDWSKGQVGGAGARQEQGPDGWGVGPNLSRGQMGGGGCGGARTQQGQIGFGVGPDGSRGQMGDGNQMGDQGVGQTGAGAWIAAGFLKLKVVKTFAQLTLT